MQNAHYFHRAMLVTFVGASAWGCNQQPDNAAATSDAMASATIQRVGAEQGTTSADLPSTGVEKPFAGSDMAAGDTKKHHDGEKLFLLSCVSFEGCEVDADNKLMKGTLAVSVISPSGTRQMNLTPSQTALALDFVDWCLIPLLPYGLCAAQPPVGAELETGMANPTTSGDAAALPEHDIAAPETCGDNHTENVTGDDVIILPPVAPTGCDGAPYFPGQPDTFCPRDGNYHNGEPTCWLDAVGIAHWGCMII